jgi:ATP-dependent exoDNAse (exonuclease V) beta subunit
LSPAGSRNWEGLRTERDALVRLGYVLMTRARESLIICEPAGSDYMPIAAMASKVAAQSRRKASVAGVADLALDGPAPEALYVPAEGATHD